MFTKITSEDINSLYPYQKETLHRQVIDYLIQNKESNNFVLGSCPKCGCENPHWTKGGRANSGKQMMRCSECNQRTVIDHGQLTYYSHQDQSKWDQLIADVFNQVPEEETAAKLDVCPQTAWNMRMKLLHALETLTETYVLKDEVELDEKYVQRSHKGKAIEGVKPRKRGEPASKRGLSNEQICLATGVQRLGASVLFPANAGNPSADDLMKLKDYLTPNSMVWTDGKTSYNALLSERNCSVRVLGDHTTYTSVDHLNNVNAFHKTIEDWYSRYRGVASKYLRRYCALLILVREYMGCDLQEIVLGIKARLRKTKDYFYIRQFKSEDLFIC